MSLTIKNLQVCVEGKSILHGIDMDVSPGKVVAIMGPNGSGKSTLANTIMGHPKYTVTGGSIFLDAEDITAAKPDVRAKKGIFLSMQYSPEIAGVSVISFLRLSLESLTGEKQHPVKFYAILTEKMKALGIPETFAARSLNVGFSGGEKKRMEILQLAMLHPRYAILDETDSGLDVDALRIVAEGINAFRSPEHGVLLITHYNRILEYIVPDVLHVMAGGRIVQSGGKELAREIERHGYEMLGNI